LRTLGADYNDARITMRVYHSTASIAHDPDSFFRRGKTIAHPESAERYRLLHRSVVDQGFDVRQAEDHGLDPLLAVHAAEYVDFIANGWNRRVEIDPDAIELLTTQFARPQMHRRPDSLLGLLGYYTADTSTPLRAGTWSAVYGAAQAAIAATDAALAEGAAYALCRPPGHHAFADCAGGFCYINNTAIAAQRLLAMTGGPIAILDVDVHHGNGTQGIFYERSEVLTVSIHADPSNYFPFYAGYAEEVGRGAGTGFNLNLPLPHGSGDVPFLHALDTALSRIRAHSPSALVIALGLDASEHDPLGVLKVTQQGFSQASRAIAQLALPTVIVQEGGYLCPALPLNLIAFLRPFDR
jgi:acetoin utilization deacetylase AcuC-like enzyme